MGAIVNSLIDKGQVWRLITCAFLHGGLIHIFFNMYALKILRRATISPYLLTCSQEQLLLTAM